MIDLLKDYFRLSSPLWPAAALALSVVWAWRDGKTRWLKMYFTALLVAFFFVTTRLGAGLMVAGLSSGYSQIHSAENARDVDAIVILGGGSEAVRVGDAAAARPTMVSMLRALEGARIFQLIHPRLAFVLGGMPRPDRQLRAESEVLRDVLVAAGVPAAAIVLESASTTTREQALAAGPLLAANHVRRFVLVTSPTHMRRSMGAFRAAGLDPIPAVAPVRSASVPPPPLLLPNDESLGLADQSTYEYGAGLYYWLRGWTRSPR